MWNKKCSGLKKGGLKCDGEEKSGGYGLKFWWTVNKKQMWTKKNVVDLEIYGGCDLKSVMD